MHLAVRMVLEIAAPLALILHTKKSRHVSEYTGNPPIYTAYCQFFPGHAQVGRADTVRRYVHATANRLEQERGDEASAWSTVQKRIGPTCRYRMDRRR